MRSWLANWVFSWEAAQPRERSPEGDDVRAGMEALHFEAVE